MGDGQTRPQQRAMASIEEEEGCWPVAEPTRQSLPNPLADPGCSEALALQVQEGYFIERVERPEAGIELQAVDDRHASAKENVLRPEIAVSIDDQPSLRPVRKQLSRLGHEPALCPYDPFDATLRQ